MYFIDARSGGVAHEYSDMQRQSAVGIGTGVLSDRKKVSARSQGGSFVADDKLRPPAIRTYDLKGDIFKFLEFINSTAPEPAASDIASDSDNTWTDGADVDAHTYAGWTYDYYFKRFGRRGLDNADITIVSVTHPVSRADIFNSPNSSYIGSLYLNAFYAGNGLMVYGEGLPDFLVDREGRSWNYVAGALDVVAHELTHGVTDYSSKLIYQGESGALNESFSDMMGTSVEFFFQPAGSGPLKADYLIGEDVVTPGGLRSMQNPNAYGDPTHYSQRYTGSADNGGVHTNSGISNNAFYLSIEGGTNPVSGIRVSGVGAANREQIEKTFYRAFVSLLPPSASFSTARAATIQSARELYGAGSAVERAVSQAWTAVGVN
jgi:thermolysin